MKPPKSNRLLLALFFGGLVFNLTAADKLRAVMFSDGQVTAASLKTAKTSGANAVVLQLDGVSEKDRQGEVKAAQRIGKAGLDLFYWIEIGRCPELADAHPEWMASLQGHTQWRRFFKDAPVPKKGVEVIKNYPWVPILYKEAFAAHRQRVARLLAGKPVAKGIFLNDLQGAPSACGCGNTLCRWTTDYGPIKTATPLGVDAAAKFVKAVSELAPKSEVIPVWVTECEKHDTAKDGLCAGVGCFRGTCWKVYTRQLMPLAAQSPRLAVLLPFKEFPRDLRLYGKRAGWIPHALTTFQTIPPQNKGKAIPNKRLIPVLQGWDVTAADIAAQKKRAEEAGAAGYIISKTKINQDWQPRLYKLSR
jgi:hypothetical protein